MALPRTKLLTAEEAAVRGAALAQQGRPVPLAALDLIDDVDPDEWRDLATRGLQKAIHDLLEIGRKHAGGVEVLAETDRSDGPTPRSLLPRPTHPAKDFWMLSLSQSYSVGGGERRPVFDFTLVDAEQAAETYRNRGYGNLAKSDAFKLTAKLLREHKADTVRQLPKAAQQSISEALR